MLRELFLKKIFVILVLGFCTGIITFFAVPIEFSSLFIFSEFVFLTLFIVVKFRNKWLLVSLLFFAFHSLGYLSAYERGVTIKTFDGAVFSGSNDIFEGIINEISYGDKVWNKALVTLKYRVDGKRKIPISEKVLFLVNEDVDFLEKGDVILLNSSILPIQNKGNPGEFDGEKYWKAKGISRIGFLVGEEFILQKKESNAFVNWFNWMDRTLSKLFEKRLDPNAVGIAKALILGDRDHLDSEAVRTFGNAGAMHVLAVSGLHVGLILALLLFIFGRFPKYISKYKATVLALTLIWFYALITGFSPSVFRAVVMFSLLTIAKVSGRNYDSINVLMISAFILLIYDPLLLFDLGFQLSYLAMLGIFLLYKPIVNTWYIKRKWLKLVWEGTAISISAQIFTLPLTLYCFHQFPNYFLISNLGLMVFANVILIVGVLLISLQIVPFISTLLAWVLSVSVISMFVFVQWVERLPASTANGFELTPIQVDFFYFIIVISLLLINKKRNFAYLGSTLIVISCLFIVAKRYNNIQKNEWVIFNENKLTLLVKMDKQIYCFYENDEDLPKSIYLAESYQKIRPGIIKYYGLADRNLELKNKKLSFSCQFLNGYYSIKINEVDWKLVKRVTPENSSSLNENSIYMPWLKLENVKGHLLSNGAFIKSI